MIQFHKDNIDPQWQDFVAEFPDFFLDPSPEVLEMWEKQKHTGGMPEKLEDCVNLRYGVEVGAIGWKGIITEHFRAVKNLIERAKNNGDEIFYKGFILKEKWWTCRNQGDFYGKDVEKYYKEYSGLVEDLFQKSTKTDIKTGEPK